MIIIGYGNPRIRYTNANGQQIGSDVNLPYCNDTGFINGYELMSPDPKGAKELMDYTLKPNIKGIRNKYTFNYDKYIIGENLMLFKTVVEFCLNMKTTHNRLILFPRSENADTFDDVVLTSTNFDLGINKGGVNAVSHRLIVFEFTARKIVTELPWILQNTLGMGDTGEPEQVTGGQIST